MKVWRNLSKMIKSWRVENMTDNFKLSNFGLGTVQFGLDYGFTKRKNQDEVNSILKTAVDNNINLIDTAREYGDSEEKIGNFISEYGNDFIIATKLKLIDDVENCNYDLFRKNIFESVNESLDNLKIDKIPILQLHQVDNKLYSSSDFWTCVEELKKENLIDKFGVSIYDLDEGKFLLNTQGNIIDYLQIPYNIFDRRFDDIFEELQENKIDLITRSTFLKGIIPCSMDNVPEEINEIKPYKLRLESLSEELNIPVDELALIFVYYNKNISSTILGVNSAEELESNVNCVNKFDESVLDSINFNDFRINNQKLIDPRQWNSF